MNLFEAAENDAPPPVEVKRKMHKQPRETIDERFARYHREHPEVYDLLVRFARDVKARGNRAKYGMKAIAERARWHAHIEKGDEKFKLCNDFTSRYSRLIEQNEPDLKGFFTTRELRTQ